MKISEEGTRMLMEFAFSTRKIESPQELLVTIDKVVQTHSEAILTAFSRASEDFDVSYLLEEDTYQEKGASKFSINTGITPIHISSMAIDTIKGLLAKALTQDFASLEEVLDSSPIVRVGVKGLVSHFDEATNSLVFSRYFKGGVVTMTSGEVEREVADALSVYNSMLARNMANLEKVAVSFEDSLEGSDITTELTLDKETVEKSSENEIVNLIEEALLKDFAQLSQKLGKELILDNAGLIPVKDEEGFIKGLKRVVKG